MVTAHEICIPVSTYNPPWCSGAAGDAAEKLSGQWVLENQAGDTAGEEAAAYWGFLVLRYCWERAANRALRELGFWCAKRKKKDKTIGRMKIRILARRHFFLRFPPLPPRQLCYLKEGGGCCKGGRSVWCEYGSSLLTWKALSSFKYPLPAWSPCCRYVFIRHAAYANSFVNLIIY